jgi:hypothetical protein
MVGDFDGQHVGDLHQQTVLLQQLFCRLPVADDQAKDAVLPGLGDAEGEDVDLGAGQKFDRER